MKIRLRLITSFVIAMCCLLTAQGASVDVDALSVEDLFHLKEKVDSRLLELGEYRFVTLERNDRGQEVINLQRKLGELGYYAFEPSGKYDSNTQIAMKLFEKSANLTPDGVASVEDQKVLFSAAFSDRQPKKAGPEPSAPPKPDPVKSLYSHIDYDEYARYPEKFDQKKILLKGKVIQVLGSRKEGFQLRLSVLNNSSNIIYIHVLDDPGYNILEGDQLYIYARLNKTISYQSIMNQTIVIPAAIAEIIELR